MLWIWLIVAVLAVVAWFAMAACSMRLQDLYGERYYRRDHIFVFLVFFPATTAGVFLFEVVQALVRISNSRDWGPNRVWRFMNPRAVKAEKLRTLLEATRQDVDHLTKFRKSADGAAELNMFNEAISACRDQKRQIEAELREVTYGRNI